jgi:hypothetical protein
MWLQLILAILVIIFAWWNVSWAPWALTVLGIIFGIMAFTGKKE